MNSRNQRRSGIGWSAIIVVIVTALIGNHFGFFDCVDGRAFDICHRFAPCEVDDKSILLIECEPAILNPGNPDFKKLLNRISQSSPLAIGVVSERAPLWVEPTAIAELHCPFVEGRPTAEIREDERSRVGYSELGPKAQPIFRYAQLSSRSPNGKLVSFERLLTARAGFLSRANRLIGIRYTNSVRSIPTITANRILTANYLPELIENRIVVVGESMPDSAGMITPASSSQRMSLLEVRGHTVLTLLSNNWLAKPGLATSFLLITLLAIGSFFTFHRRNYRHYPWILLCLFALAALSTFMAFRFLSICLPLSAMLLTGCSVATGILFNRFRILHDNADSRKLRINTHSLANANEAKSDEPWQKIASAAIQFFGPKRLALLELESESQSLKVLEAKGCVPETELNEERRDVSRDPWRQPVELGKALVQTKRSIFTGNSNSNENHEAEDHATSHGDTEFIVPLMSGSKIFGFMVLEMATTALQSWPDFENTLGEFVADFTPLIHQHRTLASLDSNWQDWLLPTESIDSEEIDLKQRVIDRSVGQVETAFHSDSCCRAMFDGFGNVIKANSRMLRRLDIETAVEEMTFSDFLPLIADVDKPEARTVFRHAIVSDQRTDLETQPLSRKGRVSVSPLAWNHDDERELSSRGLLVEIFDTHEDGDLKKLKELVGNASSSFANASMPTEQSQSLLEEIESLINTAKNVVSSNKDDIFEAVWESALFNVQPRLQRKNLSIATRFGNTANAEVRDADLVAKTTELCLSVLAECSRHSDMLKVQLLRNQTHWVLTMRNGQQDPTSNWTSPSIVGKRQAELLFAQRQKMQACGGSVDVEDTSNGEVVIHVSFSAGVLKTETQLGLPEAANV